ncbi:MAG: TonB-dependent receptor [Prevotella sp.]|jgi:TonB-linked SusC/RagA family outer membrane protein|nr:TonB-dependent receptor [Prevotella sp.]
MKLMTFFLIVGVSVCSAVNSYSQSTRLTLRLNNKTIKEALSQIEKKSEFIFFYYDNVLDVNKKVSINAENQTVDKILDELLKTTGNSYTISDRQIYISNAGKSTGLTSSGSMQKPYTLKGIVVDNAGEPLIGVPVAIKGSTVGVLTDVDGKFTIEVSPGYTLHIKYIGFQEQDILVKDQQDLRIVLYPDVTDLQDVVVVGYGTQKKASVVGAVQSISADELKVPSTRLTTSFAGRLAGVVAVQRSGEPGADGANFWIRGVSTFNGTTNPLIIIDGVEASSGDLNNLIPEVIESFSILKDATATSLYGTRGGNGVMIVTTKRGRNLDKPLIHAHFSASVMSPIKKPDTVDGVSYMRMYNESLKNGRGKGTAYSPEKIAGTAAGGDPLLYPNVDWYSEMFNNSSWTERGVFNIRGGGQKVDYFMNVAIDHENGLIRGRSKEYYSFDNNIDLWRYNFQNNIGINVTPSTLITLKLNTQLYDYSGPYTSANDLYGMIMNANPVDYPIVYPSNDPRNQSEKQEHYLWGGKSGGTYNSGFRNPMAMLSTTIQTRFESTVTANLELNQKLDFILPGLSLNALASFKNWSKTSRWRTVGYNLYYISNYGLNESGGLNDYTLSRIGGLQETSLVTLANTEGDRHIYLESRLHYDKTFNKEHSVGAMLLYSQDEWNNNNPGFFQSTEVLYASLPLRKQNIAGRASYSYKNRYLAELNFGYNGSETFAKNHRWGFFPSAAVGYTISEEPFFEGLKPVVNHMKIRASYGLVGNDAINTDNKWTSRFPYLGIIDLGSIGYTTGTDQSYSAYGPYYSRLENKDITWEIGKKLNAGIDLQLFNGSINLMVDGFREVRENIYLTRQAIPNYVGTGSIAIFGNLGSVRNHGFDIAADYNKQFGKDLLVTFKGTFTYAANKILNYDEPSYLLYPNRSRVGHSVNQLSMYEAERLFIDKAEVNNSPRQQLGGLAVDAGDIKYKDQLDRLGLTDGKIDGSDQIYAGYPTVPEITYGFGPSVQWKNWDFSFFFQGVGRTSLMMSGFHPFGTSSIRNVLQFIKDDYWSESNPNIHAAYPRLSQEDNNNNTVNSTYWLRDASFLKLKNAEIGYTYKFLKEKSFRIYMAGSNLLTFSKFKLWDPEQGGGAGFKYPTTRVFNFGVQISL